MIDSESVSIGAARSSVLRDSHHKSPMVHARNNNNTTYDLKECAVYCIFCCYNVVAQRWLNNGPQDKLRLAVVYHPASAKVFWVLALVCIIKCVLVKKYFHLATRTGLAFYWRGHLLVYFYVYVQNNAVPARNI